MLWTHILLSNAPKLYAIFIDNCIIKAATIQPDKQLLHSGKMWQVVWVFALQEIAEVSKTGRQGKYFYFTFIEKGELYIWEREALIPRSQIINFYIPSQELLHHGLQGHR